MDPNARIEELEAAVANLAHAIRLTREYVGFDMLPAMPGWEWYDALKRHNPTLLDAILEAEAAPPTVVDPSQLVQVHESDEATEPTR